MLLNNLKPIYYQLREEKLTYCIFPFISNNVTFEIFFDIGKVPFRIGFLAHSSELQLWKDINRGFNISTILTDKEYKMLVEILQLKYDPTNHFSPFKFFDQFNLAIPASIPPIMNEKRIRTVLQTFHDIEEKEKVNYKGHKDWGRSKSIRHRTPENLEKTRLIYPELYERIKDRDISIMYTANKGNQFDV